jgi:glycerol-3-phosphate dehydrogenase (NAD(P)+)
MERFCVLGAGSWGTTMACLLVEKGHDTALWVRDPLLCRSIRDTGVNAAYLPGVRLPPALRPTASIEEALEGAAVVVSAIPSHGVRALFRSARQSIPRGAIIVSATKGIEEATLLTPSRIISEELSGAGALGIVVLSGPSFAREVSRRLPAAVSAASVSPAAAGAVQAAFSTAYFRVYTNTDVIGVELGGALKNVMAIASGISDGLGLGNNSRAALITRGLAEMTRLGAAMGARKETFYGLSGLGDLVLTCTASLSRNYTVGLDLGRGLGIEEATRGMKMVAEGIRTSRAVRELSIREGVEMPIAEEVYNVIHLRRPPREAVTELLGRGLKEE